jgi:transcriptional regulator with XRE-family HTH domain
MRETIDTIVERIRLIKKNEKMTTDALAEASGIPVDTLKSMFKKNTSPSVDTLAKLHKAFPNYSLEWLIAGRDNNINNGENKGVIGNSGSIGTMIAENSGNYVVMGEQRAKKIMEPGKVTIEMDPSAELELLKQAVNTQQTRITDLEVIIKSKDEVIESLKRENDILRKLNSM